MSNVCVRACVYNDVRSCRRDAAGTHRLSPCASAAFFARLHALMTLWWRPGPHRHRRPHARHARHLRRQALGRTRRIRPSLRHHPRRPRRRHRRFRNQPIRSRLSNPCRSRRLNLPPAAHARARAGSTLESNPPPPPPRIPPRRPPALLAHRPRPPATTCPTRPCYRPFYGSSTRSLARLLVRTSASA